MTPDITGVTLSLSSTCSSQCTAGPPAWGGQHVILHGAGQYKEGGILTYISTVGTGFHSQIRPTYHAGRVHLQRKARTIHAEWPGPEVRCDDEVGRWPSCIVMATWPA